jgi:hypothetical protein
LKHHEDKSFSRKKAIRSDRASYWCGFIDNRPAATAQRELDEQSPQAVAQRALNERTADIHLASGQERHLPHEAWHVVQQARGRVQPTMRINSGVPVNDDQGLEHEADVMGEKALTNDRRAPGTFTATGSHRNTICINWQCRVPTLSLCRLSG